MEVLISTLIGIAIVIAIIMFFSPIIIIMQLSKISRLLEKQNHKQEIHHQEIMIALCEESIEEPKQEEPARQDRKDALLKSLFQDEESTTD